jgi:urea transport system substrate-binding protein
LNKGKISLQLAALLATALLGLVWLDYHEGGRKAGIKIGVLHSLSGVLAASEAPLVDAIRLAVEEANQSGGINGHPVEMIVEDCRSDAAYCAQRAEKLIAQDRVKALFGCWTSACRIAVRAVVEKHRHLLFYPQQYEGLEQSPDLIYTGAAPNQQIIPMALWALQSKGRRYYLVGSDGIYARAASLMVRDVLSMHDGYLLGERYAPMGSADFAAVAQDIAARQPDFVLNTLSGDSNLHFFRALQQAGVRAEQIPVFSTRLAEAELAAIGPELVAGHYAAWNYFQRLASDENKAFVERFKQRFGRERVLDDPMVSSFIGVRLWLEAARSQGSTDLELVKTTLAQQTLLEAKGIVAVDYSNRHLWQTAYIGRARADGQFEIAWQSAQPLRPSPFPYYRSKAEWLAVRKALMGAQP